MRVLVEDKSKKDDLEEAKKQLEFLQQIYKTVPFAIVQYTNDNTLKIINVNQAACDIHCYENPNCFLAKVKSYGEIRNTIYASDRIKIEEIINSVRQTGTREDYELRIINHDNSLRWVRGVLERVNLADGSSVLQTSYMDDTERISREAREHWQAERFKILVEAMRTIIFDYDPVADVMNYSVTLNNNTVKDFVVEKYLQNLSQSVVLAPLFVDGLKERLINASKQIIRDSYEFKANFLEQGCRWFKLYYTSVADEWGNIYRIVGRADDIQDVKNAQNYYQEEIKIRINMGSDLLAYLRINISKDIVEDVQASLSLAETIKVGMNRKKLLKSVANRLLDEAERAKLKEFYEEELMQKALKLGDKVKKIKLRTIKIGGIISWVEVSAKFFAHPVSKDIIAFVDICDISDKEMRSSVIELLMGSEYDYIATVNGNTGHFNLLAANNHGSPVPVAKRGVYEEVLAKFAHKYLPEEDRVRIIKGLSLATVLGELENKEKYVYYCACHEESGIRYKKNEYIYIDKQNKLLLTNRTDITSAVEEERQRNIKLKNALQGEKKANLAKSAFLSRMSHDIRTPLNAIIGVTALALEELYNPKKVEDYLNKASAAGKLLLGLVNDILDMSKIENKAIELHPSRYDYSEFVGNINTIIGPLCQQKHIEFIFTTGIHCEPLWVDKGRFNQIFLNILSNAVKFTPEGGTVEFDIKDLKRENNIVSCEYLIIDNGIGMSKEFQKRLYEPFTQEYSHKNQMEQGTGLGMAIVKNLVDLMGGTINVTSALGKGTRIAINMDLEIAYVETENTIKEQNINTTNSVLQGKKLLLVEDHPINTEIAKKLLQKMGIVVTCAENGQVAIDRFVGYEEGFFDAILMDIRMPVMGGIEAAKYIRSLNRADAKIIPIIAMTANAFEEDRQNTLAAGMVAHIAKPINPKELYYELVKHINK